MLNVTLLILFLITAASFKAEAACPTVKTLTASPSGTVCYPTTSAILSILSAQAGVEYCLVKDGVPVPGSCKTRTGSAVSWTVTASGEYSSYANGEGCGNVVYMSGYQTISFASPGTLSISPASPAPLCPSGTLVLTAVGGTGGYSWSTSGGVIDGPSNGSSLTVTSSGYYRVTANVSCSSPQTTSYVYVQIYNPISGGSISGTQTVCYGSAPSGFGSSANASGSNGSYNYQWESSPSGAGSWSSIGGATGAGYSAVAIYSATDFRRKVTTSCGDAAYTNTITVSVYSTVTAGSIGSNQTICSGTSPSLSNSPASSGNGVYDYQWQSSPDNSSWSDIPGATSVGYSAGALYSTTYYRRRVISCGQAAYTSSIGIGIYSALNGGGVDGGGTICVNTAPAAFTNSGTAGGADGNYSYQWQSSPDNSSWSTISGATGLGYTSPAISAVRYFRRMVTASCNGAIAYSNTLTVTVTQPGTLTVTPSSPGTLCYGQSLVLTANGGSGNYHWYSSATLDQPITFTTYPASTSGTYYVTANVPCGTATSNNVTVTIMAPLDGGSINGNAAICSGTTPSFGNQTSPTGSTGTYNYQWESRPPAGTWTALSGQTSITCTAPVIAATTEYRRKVTTTGCGDAAYSNVISVSIYSTVTAGSIGSNQTICSGTPPLFSNSPAANGDGSYAYQWQTSPDNTNWSDISGATSALYPAGALTSTTYYRRRAISCGQAVYTASVGVSIYPLMNGGNVDGGGAICVNTAPAAFTNSGIASGANGFYTYQWQKSTDLAAWTNVGTVNALGYTAPALSVKTYFRRKVTADCNGEIAYSNMLTVDIIQPGSLSISPSNPAPVCYGGSITLSAPNGTGNFHWYSSVTLDQPITFSTLPAYATGDYWLTANVACGSGTATVVHVTIMDPLAGGTINGAPTICSGTSPSLGNLALATGSTGVYLYQWESRPPAGTWTALSGQTAITCIPPAISTATEYRRKVTTTCGDFAYSNTITIGFYSAATSGTIGGAQTICTGSIPSALTQTVAPTGGTGTYVYLWQQSPNNSTWSSATGTNTTATYSPPALTATTYYRRTVTSCNTAISNTITVTVKAVSIGGTSTNAEAYGSGTGTLTVSGYTGTVIKWQKLIGVTWTDIPSSASASLPYTTATVTTSYRAVIQNSPCAVAYSSVGIVTIYPTALITTPCRGLTPNGTLQLTATAGFSTYQWSKGGVDISGATGSTLTVSSMGTYQVRVKATGTTSTYTSSPVTIGDFLTNPCNDLNYIQTIDYGKEGMTSVSSLYTATTSDYTLSTTYFDGLSRPMQSNTMGASPSEFDLIQPISYDQYGREQKKYLPYVTSSRNGDYKATALTDQASFYTNAVKVAHDATPYSSTTFEASPLNRPLQQYGPGQNWSSKPVTHGYIINYDGDGTIDGQERIVIWNISNSRPIRPLTGSVYYPTGSLTVKVTYDEDNRLVREYTDKEGHLVLKKVHIKNSQTNLTNPDNWASTYYVYDQLGQLRCVMQPELSKRIAPGTSNPADSLLFNFAFQYRYDSRLRMVSKHVPGADSVYMIYDSRDRLILTQDGNQRQGATNVKKYWTFTKYDELNRPILTGIKDTTTTVQLTQAQMQAVVNAYFVKTSARWAETYDSTATGNVHGYSNKAYPVRTGSSTTEIDPNKYLTVTYYDDYRFKKLWSDSSRYSFKKTELTGQENSFNKKIRGLVTGTKIKVLDGGVWGGYTWLKSVSYFDTKNRLIQSAGDNYKGGKDYNTTTYDFTGKALRSKTNHDPGVIWTDKIAVTLKGNKLIGTSTNWGSSGVASVQQLPAGKDGSLEVIVSEVTSSKMIGLSDSNPDANYTSIDYAIYLNGSQLKIFENGTQKSVIAGSLVAGDVLKVERTGTTIKYKRNGTLVYTSLVPSSSLLIVDVASYSNSELIGVKTSFTTSRDSVARRFEYDPSGRLIKTWHQLNNQTEILLSKNEYNELGQLIDKRLHSKIASGSDAKQSIDYRYNIRGWLTSMNNSQLVGTGTLNDDANDLFGMELGYENDISTGNASALQYNGNISAIKWSANLAKATIKERTYNYSYDGMNRILQADFRENSSSWSTAANSAYSESGYSYDLNGNIRTLTRKGKDGILIDALTYGYFISGKGSSNQLQYISDAGNKYLGFLDGATAANEYTYDANGSMNKDLNKGISGNITYNYLNLPELVTRFTGNTVQYIYDATGRKVAQLVTYGTQLKQTDYSGEFQYEDNTLQFISHEEGRIARVTNKTVFKEEGTTLTNVSSNNATVTLIRQNGDNTYIKVVSNSNVNRTGLFPIGGTINVVAGERYMVRAKGYRNGVTNGPFIQIKLNGVDYNWPGATLPSGANSEYGAEQIVAVPSGITTLQAGVVWGNVTANEEFYLNDFEIIRLETNSPEYQYNLKDHLGNVRVTFTTKTSKDIYTATLEDNSQTTEQSTFRNYSRINFDLEDHTDAGTTYTYAQLLNGGLNNQIGLTKTLSVMPGDTVKAEVYAKYESTTGSSSNISGFATALLTAFGLPNPAIGEVGTAASAINNYGMLIAGGGNPGNSSWPKGWLNILVFDRNYNLVNLQFQQLDAAYVQTGATKMPHQLLNKQVIINEPGYVYIYVSNEGSVQQNIYFDDLKISHSKSPVIQTDDYYAFGERFNSYTRENNLFNKRLYNAGSELQNDLNLNVYETEYRIFDPVLGRWWQVDPMVDEFHNWSPYNYSFNNPSTKNDPKGDCPNCVTAAIGAGIGALIGGGIELATQLYQDGEVSNWKAVGGAAIQGGITGGAAGFTGGASLLVTTGVSAGANAVGGALSNTIQGKEVTVGSVAKDAAIGVASGVGGKILDKAVGAFQVARTEKVLKSLATEAQANVTAKTGMVAGQKGFGTAAHSEFKSLVDAKALKNVATEQSYKSGAPVKYGTPGSSRADVVLKNADGTVKRVFDLKTGSATLSTKQTNNYIKNVPGVTSANQIVPIR